MSDPDDYALTPMAMIMSFTNAMAEYMSTSDSDEYEAPIIPQVPPVQHKEPIDPLASSQMKLLSSQSFFYKSRLTRSSNSICCYSRIVSTMPKKGDLNTQHMINFPHTMMTHKHEYPRDREEGPPIRLVKGVRYTSQRVPSTPTTSSRCNIHRGTPIFGFACP